MSTQDRGMECVGRLRTRRLGSFTLLEVLVATAIIGISLGVLLAGFSTNMKNARMASDYIAATQLAQLKGNELAVMKALKEGELAGDFGERFSRFRWRTSVRKDLGGKAWLIQVEILFGEGRELRSFGVSTMRAIPVAPKTPEEGKAASGNGPSESK